MSQILPKLLEMSLGAALLVLFALAFRLVFRSAPKRLRLILWALVALRLALPFSIESPLSLMPARPAVQLGALPTLRVIVTSPMTAAQGTSHITPETPVAAGFSLASLLAILYLAGVLAMAVCGVVSYGRLKRRLRSAVPLRENIWQCAAIDTPFVLGIFRPRIYLPKTLPVTAAPHVIAHEQAHIARGDHVYKLLGFALLSLHWFNPTLWLGYALFCRDIELACDERVIRNYAPAQRADYSQALLACAASGSLLRSPLAFGEVGVKARIKSVLAYKVPAFWLILLAVLACAAAAVFFLTKPAAPTTPQPTVSDQALLQMQGVLARQTQHMPTATPAPQQTSEPTPAPQPVALTPESAQTFIDQTLASLMLHQDGTVSFTIPDAVPVSEDGLTGLFINLNATFTEAPGLFAVQRVLDYATDWQAGQTFVGQLDTEKGELTEIMLRVAFMTQTGENAYKQYAANYVELAEPFVYDAPIAYAESSVQVEDGALLYTFQNGAQAKLAITLPDGFIMKTVLRSESETQAIPPTVHIITEGGDAIYGTINLYPLGTSDAQILSALDTAKDELPMEIFASVALANHAGYEDYRVQQSGETFASATAKYTWQDLSGDSPAAQAPWKSADCVLVYDYAAMPFFVEILFAENILTQQELASMAQSITITPVQ